MRKILAVVVLILLSVVAMTSFAESSLATYTLDPSHSYVEWRINHFGFSHPSGKWFANGTLKLDQNKPENSQANITIQLAELVTGNPELDKHLKSPNFFDVVSFPVATFVSNKIQLTGKDTAKIYGVLSVHGVSKPVILNTRLNKIGENPITNKQSAGFSAVTTLNRSDFGINTLLPGLSDNVDINIELEAYKNNIK